VTGGGGRGMRVVLLGPPGAGKGTQASAMARRWGMAHISSGDLLRDNVREDTGLGRRARPYMERGELVPDQLILDMMAERMGRPDAQAGFVLDGFPRTVAQAEALEELLQRTGQELDAVIYLGVPEEEILRRLSGRLTCPQCHAIYQVDTMPPKVEGICDKCGSALEQREDEQPQVVRKRLRAYEEQTAPLLAYYQSKGLLREIDGTIGVERVLAVISQVVQPAREPV
jgi:adenylate kinase